MASIAIMLGGAVLNARLSSVEVTKQNIYLEETQIKNVFDMIKL